MNNLESEFRLRIAPSPTGYPHIGTIYQALFNYAYAKRYAGKFIVRIEDTDRSRFVEDAEAVIFKALDWFDLIEDESPRKGGAFAPYKQSERLDIYQKYAQMLVEKGYAEFGYYKKEEAGEKKDYANNPKVRIITETTEEAPQTVTEMLQRKDWVLRMKVPDEGTITIYDEVRGDITFDYTQVSKQVLLKSDGYPTYHLAVVVDDHLMGITHVVRAEEWISSTPKHVLLYQYFGWELPKFYHTPDLRNPDKSKLSKRHGHTNVNWYREEGYLPEAVLNFLALQGWTHPEEKEIFTREEFIEKFDLKDIKPTGPIFDLKKLNWMNGEYIRKMSVEELEEKLIQFDPGSEDDFSTKVFKQIVPLAQSRMETLKDFDLLSQHFVDNFMPDIYKKYTDIAQNLYDRFSKMIVWNSENILTSFREVLQVYQIKMPVLYTILTGQPKGLPLPESLVILGRDKTLQRLQMYV